MKLLSLVLLTGLVSAAFADGSTRPSAPPGPSEDQRQRGQLLYRIHCLNCHGEDGSGDGPLAELLKTRPSDLTRLREPDGTIPSERLRMAIDGRAEVRGHGMREMPVWGLTFQQSGSESPQEAEVRGRIDDLLAYLKTLQRSMD